MGELVVANKTHHKEWEAKLQRVWRRRDKTGYITIVEDLFAQKDRYEVRREGKPYAFDRTYDSFDEAISMAEASMLDAECKYIDNEPMLEPEEIDVLVQKKENKEFEEYCVTTHKVIDQLFGELESIKQEDACERERREME